MAGYSISGGGSGTPLVPNTGTVTFATPPTVGQSVQVVLNVPLTQLVHLVDGGAAISARQGMQWHIGRRTAALHHDPRDQHAIRAFESNALDYLLKPFSDERLEAALARARARLTELKVGEFGQSVLQLLAATPRSESYLDRLVPRLSTSTVSCDWSRFRTANSTSSPKHGGQTRVSRTFRAALERRLGQPL